MAKMIATSKPSKNQYFTNKAQLVFLRELAKDLSLFSGSAIVADFSVYMDGVNVFFLVLSADGLFGIVTALANDELVFNLDSFMANLSNPKNNEGEAEEEEEEEEKANLRRNQDFIDMYVYIYITKRTRGKEK